MDHGRAGATLRTSSDDLRVPSRPAPGAAAAHPVVTALRGHAAGGATLTVRVEQDVTAPGTVPVRALPQAVRRRGSVSPAPSGPRCSFSSPRSASRRTWWGTTPEGAVPGPEPVAQLLGPVQGPASPVLVGNIHGQGEVLLDALSAAPNLVADRGSR